MSGEQESPDDLLAQVAERQWPITVALARPVKFGSEVIESLVFRRGRVGDLKGFKPDGVPTIDQLITIAARLCERPPKVIELLDEEDGAEVIGIAMGFTRRALMGGSKS